MAIKHLSIRVPWHDNQWQGTICNRPDFNASCTVIKNIGENRTSEHDATELSFKGQSISNFKPCCLPEGGAFMYDQQIDDVKKHPNRFQNGFTHFQDTNYSYQPYSVSATPFNWLRKETAANHQTYFGVEYDPNLEPLADNISPWLHHARNQQAMLNKFYEPIEPNESLCFLYAPEVPFVEKGGKVLVGVGVITQMAALVEYDRNNPLAMPSLIWERNIQHSIRIDQFNHGFLLPYHSAIQKNPNDFDIEELAVIVPEDVHGEFTYGTEHVQHDTAIRLLLACVKSFEQARELGIILPQKAADAIQWCNNQINRIEGIRGDYPGIGSALCALGVKLGHLVARAIVENQNVNPNNLWESVDQAFKKPTDWLPQNLQNELGPTIRQTYQGLSQDRKNLLYLLSRFEINKDQAGIIFNQDKRQANGISLGDLDILANPYAIAETSQETAQHPISASTIDYGLFRPNAEERALLPEIFKQDGGKPLGYFADRYDWRRVRAFAYEILKENAQKNGHTLLPQNELLREIRELAIPEAFKIDMTADTLNVVKEDFNRLIEEKTIQLFSLEKNNYKEVSAFQLTKIAETGKVISKKVEQRLKASPDTLQKDWRSIIDKSIRVQTNNANIPIDDTEEKARQEKASALEVLANNRFSVLVGGAGTGKTTLLSALCSLTEIQQGGVLLLAPTGKAAVKLGQGIPNSEPKTIAQFLVRLGRFDFSKQQYLVGQNLATSNQHQTVIIDECSMLTEQMLASVMQSLACVQRLILAGDYRQLAPIGAGRPFADIVRFIEKYNSEELKNNLTGIFPKTGKGFAELQIKRRGGQGAETRKDLQVAEWFSGNAIDAGIEDTWERVVSFDTSDIDFRSKLSEAHKNKEEIIFIKWDNDDRFRDALYGSIRTELGLNDQQNAADEVGFQRSFGANAQMQFTLGANNPDAWQVISPIKAKVSGVLEVNRALHKFYRRQSINNFRNNNNLPYPRPLGEQQLIYGSKVINIRNTSRNRYVNGQNNRTFLANGEIGLAVAGNRNAGWLNIEFSSQNGGTFGFSKRDFGQEEKPPIELAYAITIHKSQGSEFDTVFFVLPNPCFLLTRELLYTALTRQKNRVIVLHQGDFSAIKELAKGFHSEIGSRYTNLFEVPKLRQVNGSIQNRQTQKIFEENLIHVATDGTLLRSKSEMLIYQHLLSNGLTPEYEQPLEMDGVTKYPDFTIENDDLGVTYYWEHCGLLHYQSYRENWQKKLSWYRENSIMPIEEGGTLIITEEESGFSMQKVKEYTKMILGD